MYNQTVPAISKFDESRRRRQFMTDAATFFMKQQVHVRCSKPRHPYLNNIIKAVQSLSLVARGKKKEAFESFSKRNFCHYT